MLTIRLRPEDCLSDEDADALSGALLTDKAYERLITEDCDVYKPDGQPLLKFRKKVLPVDQCATAYAILKKVRGDSSNRGNATYAGANQPRVRLDGTKSKSNAVPTILMRNTSSGIVGFFDRYIRFPYCRQTAFNIHNPQLFSECMPFFRSVDAVFKSELPERYAAQLAAIEKTSNDFYIKGTAFTTVTVNRNWQTAVHKDSGDLKEGFGVMTVLRAGNYSGGYYVMPKYKVAVDIRSTDLIMSDVHEWHGNTKLVGVKGQFERISCVFYYRENMLLCGTAAEELERAKRRKQGDKLLVNLNENL